MASDPERGQDPEAGRLLALGVLVPGVVHELNNALLGLLGMLELAQTDATGPVAERLGIAQQAGEEIREIARVLGMLAREPLDAGVVDVRDVAAEVASAAEALNIVRGLELVQVLGPDPVPVALGAAQLRHALLLLVACAFQSCGRQGPLLVEVGAADGKAEIAVRHSGAGVAEQPEVDPGFEHVAAWASARGGSAARERTRVTLALPLAR